ncbi:glycosyltransferase family 2 protein [Anaerolentibacter hominis]|uniref:glycosyltransferase family 2 protein n=1 Tax=Anaerolentibacter hominis TaxID=3079009 RepID=UPI0031B84214
MDDLVSIVMTSYNGENYIADQIRSILDQTWGNFELTIWDDGSTDRTAEIVSEFCSRFPDKISFHKNVQNKGVVKNFLEGAQAARGDYVMFADQDDWWLEDKIARTLNKMKQLEGQCGKETPLAVFTDVKVTDGELFVTAESFHKSDRLDVTKTDLAHLLMENKLIGCTVMFNRALGGKLDYMPQKARYHDWWVGLIAASFGQIGYVKQPTMLYRQHGGNQVGDQSFKGYVAGRVSDSSGQRKAIADTISQGRELLEHFGAELPEEKTHILREFVRLADAGFLKKRYLLLKYGFLKSGLVRNLGLMVLI